MKDTSGPAFPTDEYYDEKPIGQAAGMTLRDYFAGQALVGLLADSRLDGTPHGYAVDAYAYADAMLKAR